MKVQIVNSTLHIGSLQFLCQDSRGIEELQLIVNGRCLVPSTTDITNNMETHTGRSSNILTAKAAGEMTITSTKVTKGKAMYSPSIIHEVSFLRPQTVLILQV